MVSKPVRNYEMVVVLNPEANEEEVSATVQRLDDFITERGGAITDHQNWGLRALAYPIQNFQEGNYVLTLFTADPAAVPELDRAVEASEDILRHLVTRV